MVLIRHHSDRFYRKLKSSVFVGHIVDVRVLHDSTEALPVTRLAVYDDVTRETFERTCNCWVDGEGNVINRTGGDMTLVDAEMTDR